MLVCSARQVKTMLASADLTTASSQRRQELLERVRHFENNLIPLRRSLRFQKMEIPLSPATLKIQAFGEAQVYLDGKPITSSEWQTQATRELFFLILSQPQGLVKETPGEILWPGSTHAQLNNRFKNAIYRLRRALRQDVIFFDRERYSFNRNLDYTYDVERFEQLLLQVEEEKSPQFRKEMLEEVVQIYRGDYLSDINGAWVMAEREHLRQVFLDAGIQLAAFYMDDMEPEKVLEICQRLISMDGCFERAYYLAMQALAAKNDIPGVVRLYEKLQTNLEKELGIAPSLQASTLFHSVVH